MFIYIAIAILLFFFAYTTKGSKSGDKIYLMMTIVLILFDGLRWESGSDWDNYYSYFNYCLLGDNSHFEIGYALINKAIRLITSNYTWFLIIHALILYGSVRLFFKKNSIYPLLSLALFFSFFVSYQGMNRQFLAVSVCLLAYNFLVENKKLPFILLVVTGSLFHISAFFFLIGLFFTKQFKNKTYAVFLIITIVIGNLGFVKTVINVGLSFVDMRFALLLDFYSDQEQAELSLVGIIVAYFRRLLCIVPMLFYMKKHTLPKTIQLAFNFYFIGFVTYIIFNGTVLQIMVSRGNVYFMIFECLLFPYILYVYKKKISTLLLFTSLTIFALANMIKGLQYYDVLGKNQNPFIPYKSIYYNTDVRKNTR